MDKSVAEKAIQSQSLIEEEDVECRPEKISNAVLDENVDVYLVRNYFTADAWMVVEDTVKRKSEKNHMDL